MARINGTYRGASVMAGEILHTSPDIIQFVKCLPGQVGTYKLQKTPAGHWELYESEQVFRRGRFETEYQFVSMVATDTPDKWVEQFVTK